MAEISTAGIPEPDGDFGIWGVKNNRKVVQLIEGHNDHDGKIAANAVGLTAEQAARAAADAALQAEIDAIPDGPPGPPGGSDEAFAEWVEDPASLTNAAVTAQIEVAAGPVLSTVDGSIIPGIRFRVLADPSSPFEIDDIVIEAI